MLIAVAASEMDGRIIVPETFEESERLYIVETEGMKTIALYNRKQDDPCFLARKVVYHKCEAIACGKFTGPEAFDVIADGYITRYNATGIELYEAADAAERGKIPVTTKYEGSTGCDNHHH